MNLHINNNDSWKLVDKFFIVTRPFGAVIIIFGLISLAGYFGAIEEFYRPIENGPATHPLTATVSILLGFSLYRNINNSTDLILQRTFSIAAFLLVSVNLIDTIFSTELTQFITPFYQQVVTDISAGKSNDMGGNTAFMLLTIASSITLHNFKKPILSQLLATIAASIPLITFLGYAFGLESFYGQMSMFTATSGFALSIAAISLTANKGLVYALLSPYIGGRVARFQVLAGYIVPMFLGYLLVKTIVTPEGSLFGLFVIGICWFILIMVGVSAVVIEDVDHKRRKDEKKLQEIAMTDDLTGLANRRMFFDTAKYEMARINRANTELWVLMLDIDLFKNINDKAGHAIGDKVLMAVSNTLKSSLREVDIVGRIGGEEFAIILTDTQKVGVERVAENIRVNIEKTVIDGWTNFHGPVTISIGIAKADSTIPFEKTLAQADEALYQAKETGRNRACFYSC